MSPFPTPSCLLQGMCLRVIVWVRISCRCICSISQSEFLEAGSFRELSILAGLSAFCTKEYMFLLKHAFSYPIGSRNKHQKSFGLVTILFCWSFVVVLSWVLAQDQCVSFFQLIYVCGYKQTSALSTSQQDCSDEKEGQRHSSHDEWKK